MQSSLITERWSGADRCDNLNAPIVFICVALDYMKGRNLWDFVELCMSAHRRKFFFSSLFWSFVVTSLIAPLWHLKFYSLLICMPPPTSKGRFTLAKCSAGQTPSSSFVVRSSRTPPPRITFARQQTSSCLSLANPRLIETMEPLCVQCSGRTDICSGTFTVAIFGSLPV